MPEPQYPERQYGEPAIPLPLDLPGLALHRAGRIAEAVESYRLSLQANPDHPRILGLLGQLEIKSGAVEQGLAHLARARDLMPSHGETRFAYANACVAAGLHDEAANEYRKLLAQRPDHAGAAQNLTMLLRHHAQYREAAAVARAALVFRPGDARLLAALAEELMRRHDPAAALGILDRAAACEPDLIDVQFLRGTCLNKLGHPQRAEQLLRAVIARAPGHAAAHLNLGNVLADQDRLDEALEFCCQAIALDERLAEAHASLGHIMMRLGDAQEAMQWCRRALEIAPRHVQAHWNLGIAALLAGDWRLGWQQYEWRKHPELYAGHFRIPRGEEWRGGPIAGRTLTICAEQGYGDAIQLARFAPLLRARGAKLILSCANPLMELMRNQCWFDAVIDRAGELPDADLWVDQMSLPGIFGTMPDHVPLAEGYINAGAGRAAAWRAILPDGIKVGLVWGGNADHSNDARRSLPAEELEYLFGTPGVAFVSLQVGRAMPERWQGRVFDAAPRLIDFADTAACVANLDLLITVDTSAAHLAGAMGCEVWMMLPFASDWRWMQNRADTPWYRSMRLFRQPGQGDWQAVIGKIASALLDRFGFAGVR